MDRAKTMFFLKKPANDATELIDDKYNFGAPDEDAPRAPTDQIQTMPNRRAPRPPRPPSPPR